MNAKHALEQLLDLLFGPNDLRRFIEAILGETVDAGTQSAGGRAVAAAVESLELRAAVDSAFFDRLLDGFPERAPEIEQVACLWLPDRGARAAPPARPMDPAGPESGVWDIFLAHAAPDAPAAAALYDALTESGLDCFLDSRRLRLGQHWDDAIPAALAASRLVAVLVSGRTRDAWYTRDEIALAIDAARGRGGPDRVPSLVIPVYLEGLPEQPSDWLFGLRGLQGIVASDLRWPGDVAERLIERLDELEGEGAGTADRSGSRSPASAPSPAGAGGAVHPSPPTTPVQYLDLAMDLDRSDQWLALLEESRSPRNGILLLHGERRQNLELFLHRLWNRLSEEMARHIRIVPVSERWEAELPRTPAAWEIHLRYALEQALAPARGTAADLIAEATRHGPLLLLIGSHPLSRDGLDDDEEVIAALGAFLEEGLPALLAGCPGPHPVRALVATDHDRPEQALAERFYNRMLRGRERHGIRVRRLPEVKHVSWDHIAHLLDRMDPPPPSKVYRTLEQAYDDLDHATISFHDLAERLSRRL